MEISVQEAVLKKAKPSADSLGFGKYFTDHMFVMDFKHGEGWHDPRIIPYGPFPMEPSCSVLHYGQGVFEGMKAYRAPNGRILLFRPGDNMDRLNQSCDRMCIPKLDGNMVLESLKTLLRLDADWVPDREGTSLYIRPFVISTDTCLGVKPSLSYRFFIILSPVGNYYTSGLNPARIYVEEDYVRSVRGGTGSVKTMGNYATGLRAQEHAFQNGCVQVLWLDALQKSYVEEVGSMNVFFRIRNTVITPELTGTILPGITRSSVLEMLKRMGVQVMERKISMDEVIQTIQNHTLLECFGTGTAAVISPVGELLYRGQSYVIGDNKTGELTLELFNWLIGIQNGTLPDRMGWTVEL